MIIINILFSLIFIYFAFSIGYMLFFSVAGLLLPQKKFKTIDPKHKFAVLIAAYKGDDVILETAIDATRQQYPSHLFDVYVLADKLQPATIETLKSIPVKVIEMQFEQSTKAKSLTEAVNIIPENLYDYVVILDIDNLMEPTFLHKLNDAFATGYKAIQAHRTAKNTNTSFAILDGISEEINNHIFRKGHVAVGLSSALIGSGMAFDFLYFKQKINEIKAVGGFDKELELAIISEGNKIAYLNKALVYDEKVMKAEVFGNQRRRWLSVQMIYLRKNLFKGLAALKQWNVDFFVKTLQYLVLPRILLLGGAFFMAFVSFFIPASSLLTPIVWLSVVVVYCLALFIGIPASYYTWKTAQAIFSIPQAFMIMLFNIFKLKGANKQFIHTPHTSSKELNNK